MMSDRCNPEKAGQWQKLATSGIAEQHSSWLPSDRP
jgi:hypothetical protein